ncbi:DNA mismatch repair protein MutT, partial [Veillonellaceae bacterium M2-8]|nr:DNA mismatch repair protein MutT [Veillonellaceae bacterium M2-8]
AWVRLKDLPHQLAYPNERRIVSLALDLLYQGQ